MAETTSRFPLGLCLAATLATGAGLIVSAAGWQWGAAPAEPDALQRAWMYVQCGWMWTWLLVWPSMALGKGRATVRRSVLLLDFVVIVVAAIPALGVAGFVSGVNGAAMLPVLAVQVGTGLLAMGLITCGGVLPAAVMAGVLAMFAVVMPVVGYAWSEFFPAASQNGWTYFPMEALASALSGGHAAAYAYAACAGLMGILLVATLGSETRKVVPKP